MPPDIMTVLPECKDRFCGDRVVSLEDCYVAHRAFGTRADKPMKQLCCTPVDPALETDARQLHRIYADLRERKNQARAVLLEHVPAAKQASHATREVRDSHNVCCAARRGGGTKVLFLDWH